MDFHKKFWNNIYSNKKEYRKINYSSDFVIFSSKYFPTGSRILELGAGTGEDTLYLLEKNFKVLATDFSEEVVKNLEKLKSEKLEIKYLDIKNKFPFEDNSFDVVLANLVIHYFNKITTQKIYDEIYRVLKPNGIIAVLVNSKKEHDYGSGEKIEEDFYLVVTGRPKRYFTPLTLKPFINKFKILILDDKGSDARRTDKVRLIRFIGKK